MPEKPEDQKQNVSRSPEDFKKWAEGIDGQLEEFLEKKEPDPSSVAKPEIPEKIPMPGQEDMINSLDENLELVEGRIAVLKSKATAVVNVFLPLLEEAANDFRKFLNQVRILETKLEPAEIELVNNAIGQLLVDTENLERAPK